VRTSENIGELSKALAAASVKLTDPVASRTANAGRYGYNYATLGDALPIVRPVLGEQGLCVFQAIDTERKVLVTRMAHASGEWVETDYPVTLEKDPQKQGGAVTYARRYALFALLGLAPVDDDEAATSGAKASQAQQQRPQPAPQPPAMPKDERDRRRRKMAALMEDSGLTYAALCAHSEAQNWGSPSTWGNAQVVRFLRDCGYVRNGNQWTHERHTELHRAIADRIDGAA